MQPITEKNERPIVAEEVPAQEVIVPNPSAETKAQANAPAQEAAKAAQFRFNAFGWPVPSSISEDPEQARSCIHLPEFEHTLLEKARVISGRFPLAEAEYRQMRGTGAKATDLEIPHFERVFRIASAMAGIRKVQHSPIYDALLVLTAWHSVRPGFDGFLGSYPKALLCPISHGAPPTALESLSVREQGIFQRRAPYYLRYLLCNKFGLRTCSDIENADLRHLLRSTGFRLIRSSEVAEVAFPGITRGEDPSVRPWKMTLRQELSDERAAEMLITAALWQIKYGLKLVTFEAGLPRWNIGAFAKTDWEDVFLSLGVRVAPSLSRESGLFDWRAVLMRCVDEIGRGNLPPEVLGKVSAWPQRICHDSQQAIWEGLDHVARMVMDRARAAEPRIFAPEGGLDYENARSFRGWARLFDEVSPQILSRFGVSAFTALHRIAPEYFGWGCSQLKPWELEQEYGKWKGPRGKGLLRSAYAFALFENGLGDIVQQDEQVVWQCTLQQFSDWSAIQAQDENFSPYEFLYAMASRHGLTPLLNREVTHTAAISLLAGINLHQHLPKIEGCWEVCLRSALEHHSGKLEVRLVLPDLVPLPLRLRKAVLAPLKYSYLHKGIKLVRDFDLRMAREARCKLEELPGWWEDERIVGTPLEERLKDAAEPALAVLKQLRPEPWLEPCKVRFRALQLLTSKQAADGVEDATASLSSEQMRALLRLAMEATLENTNIMQVSVPAIKRGFERLLARDDTREMLDSLLLHIGTANETEIWGQVRKLIVLDVINDLLALTVRTSLLHLMSSE
jgi:hypothetical protein